MNPSTTPSKTPAPKILVSDLRERYSPLYFLAALGAGGLAVSFFMYLMWLTPHPGSPIPTFASLAAALPEASLPMVALIVVSLAGVALFAALHVALLAWNLRELSAFRRTPAYETLRAGNGESQLMAYPLALAMAVNVAFIVGALFVPGLWSVREILFPIALLAFGAIGALAFRIYLDFLGRILTEGGYDCAKSNSLGQMISVFALAMVGVGFSATAAMSHVPVTSAIGFLGATFFTASAVVLGLVKLVLGFRSMMENRAGPETTPTLWIVVPLLTVIGIAIYRLKMALAHNFGVETAAGEVFALLATLLSVQILFMLIGWAVMKRAGYYGRWVAGPDKSPGSLALVCPGVGLFVMGNFLVNPGLVGIGLVEPLSLGYGLLYAPLVAIQVATIWLFFKLSAKLFLLPAQPTAAGVAAA